MADAAGRKAKAPPWGSGAFYEEAGGAGWGTAGFLTLSIVTKKVQQIIAGLGPGSGPRRWKLGSFER